MEFKLNEVQSAVKELAAQIGQGILSEQAETFDQNGSVPFDTFHQLAEAGLLGIPFPEKYGGIAAGYESYAIAIEELAKVASSVTTTMLVHNAFLEAIMLHGTEAQKTDFLPPGIAGKFRASMAFTEPGTGSDPKQLTTVARKEGNKYILNGTKRFISNAAYPGPILLYAKDAETGGCTAFVFDKLGPGYSLSTPWEKVGVKGSPIYDVFLDNVEVPESQILGEAGNGFKVLLDTVSYSKIGFCASFVGSMAASYELAVKYAKEKLHRGIPISKFQAIQIKTAQVAAKLESARLMVQWLGYTANVSDDRDYLRAMVSMVKAYVSDLAVETNLLCMNILGAYGVTTEYRVERHLRDSLIAPHIEGVSDVHRIICGSYLLTH